LRIDDRAEFGRVSNGGGAAAGSGDASASTDQRGCDPACWFIGAPGQALEVERSTASSAGAS